MPGIPDPTGYKHQATIPPVGTPDGRYTGEFASSAEANTSIDPASLPDRPFIGTELYWISDSAQNALERQWLEQLELDFLRIEVDAQDVKDSQSGYQGSGTDFAQWKAGDFEGGKGWHFNNADATVTNVLDHLSIVRFPVMMMMHYGEEKRMGVIPDSDAYAEYFLATVYYYNVIRGMNIKYWEVLNEPDWGWGDPSQVCSPSQYAAIFNRIAQRIKNHPDPRVNSIRLGGPVLGSGDPIDGAWPDGYANRTSDGERQWRGYIPTLLAQGSRPGQHDVGFLSWHDYGSDSWGLPNSIYSLDRTYALANRVNGVYALTKDYTAAAGEKLPLVVSEMNLAAGKTKSQSKDYYKNFYAALWHTSTLNNYFSTGKVTMISHFYWKGRNDWPKGLVYKDADSGDQVVRNPVWWAYREYIQHTQTKILASSNGQKNPWADVIVTTDAQGQMLYVIAVNKSDQPQTVDFSFDVPASLLGSVAVSKEVMVKGGSGTYGEAFKEPVISYPYRFQPLDLQVGKRLRYQEALPPLTITYYTLVKMEK